MTSQCSLGFSKTARPNTWHYGSSVCMFKSKCRVSLYLYLPSKQGAEHHPLFHAQSDSDRPSEFVLPRLQHFAFQCLL